MNLQKIIQHLEEMANPEKVKIKEEKFGVTSNNSLGIYHKDLKELAKEIGVDNNLAFELFDSGIYEARILCSKIYNPHLMTKSLMEKWVVTFENWEICDSFCMGVFSKSQHALAKAIEWSSRDQEFIKRAGFVIMASYGFANKNADNEIFKLFLPIIKREAIDDRLYVKKAVNWALRNIGKRNRDLQDIAISEANNILHIESQSARWIARDALKELNNPDVKIFNYPRKTYGQNS